MIINRVLSYITNIVIPPFAHGLLCGDRTVTALSPIANNY